MNQYATKIWKYDSDNLSAIQFEFLNGSSIYYYPERKEWFGVDKHHEPINPKKVDVLKKKHKLMEETQNILSDYASNMTKYSDGWWHAMMALRIFNDEERNER